MSGVCWGLLCHFRLQRPGQTPMHQLCYPFLKFKEKKWPNLTAKTNYAQNFHYRKYQGIPQREKFKPLKVREVPMRTGSLADVMSVSPPFVWMINKTVFHGGGWSEWKFRHKKIPKKMNLNDYQRAIQLAENSEVFQTVNLFREKSILFKKLFFRIYQIGTFRNRPILKMVTKWLPLMVTAWGKKI